MVRLWMFLLCSFGILHSIEWHDYWIQGVLNCDKKNYKDAEVNFTEAIKELESKKDSTKPHVFVDRARLYLLLSRYHEALLDVNRAIQSGQLPIQDLPRAIMTRMSARTELGMMTEALEDLEWYKKVNPDLPKYEFYEDKIIVRNLPENPLFREMMKKILIATFCEQESDIQMLPSGICIAKKKKCNCNKHSTLDKAPKSGYGEGCKWWCDKAALGGFSWCGLRFRSKLCQGLCIGTVELLKDGCYWCCNNKGFYENCVKPFENILMAMGNTCDPAWD